MRIATLFLSEFLHDGFLHLLERCDKVLRLRQLPLHLEFLLVELLPRQVSCDAFAEHCIFPLLYFKLGGLPPVTCRLPHLSQGGSDYLLDVRGGSRLGFIGVAHLALCLGFRSYALTPQAFHVDAIL